MTTKQAWTMGGLISTHYFCYTAFQKISHQMHLALSYDFQCTLTLATPNKAPVYSFTPMLVTYYHHRA